MPTPSGSSPTTGTVPLGVVFTDESSPADVADEWMWTFGTGDTSTAQRPVYTYTQGGIYTVTLTVTDTETGEADVLTRTNYITVSSSGGGYTTTTTVITYTYDPLNRLTKAEYSDGDAYEYQYDEVGNRQAMTTTEGSVAYIYDAANRLTSVGGVSYTYDHNGNLTSDGTYTYTWNVAGRLVGVESVTTTVVYTYNGDGVRVAQSVDGQITRWVQTLASHCTSYNRLSNSGCGLPQVLVETTSGETTLYSYGLGRLAQVQGNDAEWFLGDALGSVRQIVDDGGDVVLARDYAPFGLLRAEAGTGSSGYGFTGEQFEHSFDIGSSQFECIRAASSDMASSA